MHWNDVGKLKTSYIDVENVKWYSYYEKQFNDSSKSKTDLYKWPTKSIPMYIYPKELNTETKIDTFPWVFIAELFAIAKL